MQPQQPTPDTKELDQYELALVRKKDELQACQKEHGLESCYNCDKLLECELRKAFVDAAYRSMHKDKGGGFEF